MALSVPYVAVLYPAGCVWSLRTHTVGGTTVQGSAQHGRPPRGLTITGIRTSRRVPSSTTQVREYVTVTLGNSCPLPAISTIVTQKQHFSVHKPKPWRTHKVENENCEEWFLTQHFVLLLSMKDQVTKHDLLFSVVIKGSLDSFYCCACPILRYLAKTKNTRCLSAKLNPICFFSWGCLWNCVPQKYPSELTCFLQTLQKGITAKRFVICSGWRVEPLGSLGGLSPRGRGPWWRVQM